MGTRWNRAEFAAWLDVFVQEKGLDLDHVFAVEGPDWGMNYISLAVIVELCTQANDAEQQAVKAKLVALDFLHSDPMGFFAHLAKAVAL